MSNVTAELVKELRDRTGVGMAKCKTALEEAAGDIEKAIEILRKAGIASAVKRESREAKEGLIGMADEAKAISLVEINSETDFVAQNNKFKDFLKEVAQMAAEKNPRDVAALLALKSKSNPSQTLDETRALVVQSLGENIQIKRIHLFQKSPQKSIGIYSHMGGKIMTAVELSGGSGNEALARDIAMHIAADAPEYLKPSDVPPAKLETEKDIAKSQIKNKPANIIDKIVEGKLQAYYDQVCLLCQKYVKDNSVTIQELLSKESKRLGKTLEVVSFLRWQVGA